MATAQTPSIRAGMLSKEAVSRWLAYIARFTARTQEHYRMVTFRFAQYLPDNIANLTVEHIDRYLAGILKKYTPRTCNSHLTVVKSFCRFLSERFDLPNPASKVKMLPEQPPVARVLTHDELQKVLSVCLPIERDVIELLAHTALRASEFCSLTQGCISLEKKCISIVGKGRKRRVVPLSKTCCEIVARYGDSFNFIKSYSNRKKLYLLCVRLAKRAGVPKFGPHAIRHFTCTELVKRGVPLVKVSRLLGHSSVKTTERIYVHLLPSDLQGVTDCLN